MKSRYILHSILILTFVGTAIAQRPPQGPPGAGGPPREGRPPKGENGPDRPDAPPPGGWIKPLDTNQNGILERDEFRAAADRTFAELDKNANGTLEPTEIRRQPRNQGGRPTPPAGDKMGEPKGPQGPPNGEGKRILPPFFFQDQVQEGVTVTRADFDTIVNRVFAELDTNSDRAISREEAKKLPKRQGPPPVEAPEGPPPPPNGKFIAAEMRFGDKLVKGQPFSAETVIEDTRLLFDGSLVKKEIRGNIYRDSNGRTRREMPLALVGGYSVVGSDNMPQELIFINDFASKTQYFIDPNTKVARKSRIDENQAPPLEIESPKGAKIISDGTQTIEGISCEQTRTEFEIPVGQFGNQKALKAVSERCFSPELQVVIMSLHQDPMNGLHVFKLVNIKRSEPAAELFSIPTGFRIEGQQGRRPE